MANIRIKNAQGNDVYLAATGAGTDGDPHVPEQSVTGPLTNAELRGAAVLTQMATLPDTAAGDLAAIAAGVGGGLTDTELRASAVPTAVSSVTLPAAVYSGQKSVTAAGTDEALAASQALVSGVTVKALHGNTGMIYVGPSGVSSTTGYVLDAGESVFIEVGNLASVYVDAEVSGETCCYVAA